MDKQENLDLIRRYIAALEAGKTGAELAAFFAEDARQIELPNQLNPTGQESDLAQLLERAAQGQQILSSQKFEIRNELADGDRLAVQADWTGVLAIPVANLPAGGEMKAHFAMFFEIRDGRIYRQHNYDCFEPLEQTAS